MSWQLAYTKCLALTGKQHITIEKFADVLAGAYDDVAKLHMDVITGTSVSAFIDPGRKQLLKQGIITEMNKNLLGGDNNTNLLQQFAPYIQQYWAGIQLIGPNGIVSITYPGIWINPWIKQNNNFIIMVVAFIVCAVLQILTMVGIYASTIIPGLVSPWSGLSLRTFG